MKHLLIILLLLPTLAHSEQWFTNGEPDNKNNNLGGVKNFGAMVLMTTDSKKALENWSIPTKGVAIPSAEIVEKGKPIEALVFFSGCNKNKSGNCVSEVDYVIYKPDGTIYAEYKKTELWRNKPAFPKGKIGLAVDRVGLIADPEDPIGIYKVKCTVKDLVANYQFTLFTSFKVIEANK